MTKYLDKSFSVAVGSDAYSKGYDQIDWSDGDKRKHPCALPDCTIDHVCERCGGPCPFSAMMVCDDCLDQENTK